MKIRKHLCSSIVIILSLTSCLEAKNNGSFRIIHNNDGSEILGTNTDGFLGTIGMEH